MDDAGAAFQAADAALVAARTAVAAARETEARLRGPASEADRKAQRLDTEVATLKKLLASGTARSLAAGAGIDHRGERL